MAHVESKPSCGRVAQRENGDAYMQYTVSCIHTYLCISCRGHLSCTIASLERAARTKWLASLRGGRGRGRASGSGRRGSASPTRMTAGFHLDVGCFGKRLRMNADELHVVRACGNDEILRK